MAATSKIFSPILPLRPPWRPFFSNHCRPIALVVRATFDSDPSDANPTTSTTDNFNGSENSTGATSRPQPLRIRYRSKRAKKRQMEAEEGRSKEGEAFNKTPLKEKKKKKTWEDMGLGEKALELYVGEKGLLFWLNKFAYASIFIVIGGWILFRFVGPAINLYQLEGVPLSPGSMFKSSPPST